MQRVPLGQKPSLYLCYCTNLAGDYSEEETPVPIPNTAVKLFRGDGTVA